MALPVLTSGMSFDEAAESVLAYLREHVPMGFWSVTRVENARQSYLYLGDNVYGLPKGGSHPWEDSYCVHMAAGTAPAVAPRAQDVPAYRDAAVNAAVTIGAYAGAVISEPDGSVFGAICGLDTEPHDEELLAAEPLLNLLGSLLNMVLGAERARDEAAAAASDARSDAETDLLTGLLNRRGWERSVAAAEDRFARLADPTIVVMVDLDRLKDINDSAGHAAGDRYIVAAGRALRAAARPTDVLARLGGDEFGLIMSGCPRRPERPRSLTSTPHSSKAPSLARAGGPPSASCEVSRPRSSRRTRRCTPPRRLVGQTGRSRHADGSAPDVLGRSRCFR